MSLIEQLSAIDRTDYSGPMYRVAWQTPKQNFGRSVFKVNAQLKKIYSYGFINPHESADIIKFLQTVSGCVNVFSQYGYESDIAAESARNSEVSELTIKMKKYISSDKTGQVKTCMVEENSSGSRKNSHAFWIVHREN